MVMHQYINTTPWIHLIVCVYVISELTTLHWTTVVGAHPWERLILCLPAVIGCLYLGKSPHEISPFLCWCTNYCHCSRLAVSTIFSRDSFTGHFLVVWCLQSFCLYFLNIYWALDAWDMVQTRLSGLESSDICILSSYGFLWWSPKRGLFDEQC